MRWLLALMILVTAVQVKAQPVQTEAEALEEDAEQYAAQFTVSADEATRRLKAEQESVSATDAIGREFSGRIAGISIVNSPDYHIEVLLTGNEPVAPRTAAGVPILFRTGARATHQQAIAALRRHLIDLRTDLPNARGAGYDQRTGEIVLLVTKEDAGRFGIDTIRSRAERLGGVPVRVTVNELDESNMGINGGGRVEGLNLSTNRQNLCTTAFVVTNGETHAIATAAHCPDELTYVDRDGTRITLPLIGSWGAAYRDVQLNGTPDSPQPLFYSNRAAGTLREVVSWRNVASTRAGDFVCHYGESSGYSCSTVELTDYAPPGDLCGGPCSPTWVTVRGPSCVPGDSGGPVFSGEVAFGIAKGINREGGRCLFYYYMSTDYLPDGWHLLVSEEPRRQGLPSAGKTQEPARPHRFRSSRSGSAHRHERPSASTPVPPPL